MEDLSSPSTSASTVGGKKAARSRHVRVLTWDKTGGTSDSLFEDRPELWKIQSASHEGNIFRHQRTWKPPACRPTLAPRPLEPIPGEQELLYLALYREKVEEVAKHQEALAGRKTEQGASTAARSFAANELSEDEVEDDIAGTREASSRGPLQDPEGASSHVASVRIRSAHGGVMSEYLETKRLEALFEEWHANNEEECEARLGPTSRVAVRNSVVPPIPRPNPTPGSVGLVRSGASIASGGITMGRTASTSSSTLTRLDNSNGSSNNNTNSSNTGNNNNNNNSSSSSSSSNTASERRQGASARGLAKDMPAGGAVPAIEEEEEVQEILEIPDPETIDQMNSFGEYDIPFNLDEAEAPVVEETRTEKLFGVLTNPKTRIVSFADRNGDHPKEQLPSHIEGFPVLALSKLYAGPWRLEP